MIFIKVFLTMLISKKMGQRTKEFIKGDNMNNYDAVMIAEGAHTATQELQIEAWQHLIDTGLAWSLQGAFGRKAEALIEAGFCTPGYQDESREREKDLEKHRMYTDPDENWSGLR